METGKVAGLLELLKQLLAKQEKDLVAALKEQAEEMDSLIQKVQGLQELFRPQFGNQQTTKAGAGDRRCYSCGQLGHFEASCRQKAMHRQQWRVVDNPYVYPDYFHRPKQQWLRRQVISSVHATSRSISRWPSKQKQSPMTATGRASPRRTLSSFGLTVAHLVLP